MSSLFPIPKGRHSTLHLLMAWRGWQCLCCVPTVPCWINPGAKPGVEAAGPQGCVGSADPGLTFAWDAPHHFQCGCTANLLAKPCDSAIAFSQSTAALQTCTGALCGWQVLGSGGWLQPEIAGSEEEEHANFFSPIQWVEDNFKKSYQNKGFYCVFWLIPGTICWKIVPDICLGTWCLGLEGWVCPAAAGTARPHGGGSVLVADRQWFEAPLQIEAKRLFPNLCWLTPVRLEVLIPSEVHHPRRTWTNMGYHL